MLSAFTSVWILPLHCIGRIVSSTFEAVCLQSLQFTNNSLTFHPKCTNRVLFGFILEKLHLPGKFRWCVMSALVILNVLMMQLRLSK